MTTSTSTTTPPAYYYRYGRDRKAGLTAPAAEIVDIVLPAASATNLDPYSLKDYVDFDGNTGIFDGAGANRVDDGETLKNLGVRAPQHRVSFSSTTSTTSSSTSTTSTSTTTSAPTTTTTTV